MRTDSAKLRSFIMLGFVAELADYHSDRPSASYRRKSSNVLAGEAETAAALALTDRYLSAQPKVRNDEEGQFGDIPAAVGADVLVGQHRLAEADGNRTHRSGGQPG